MRADLVRREPERLALWERQEMYRQIRASRANRPRFVLHDGPPFANGDVHIGTALNKILKDVIVKYQTLAGQDAPYVPGWDCHGLPIEFKVTQNMRQKGEETADAAEIRRRCEAYARKYIDLQRNQFRRLGIFGDWDEPYLTLNKAYEAEELELFADIVAKGLVYRGKKPVYWSIPCRTALAEAEVEYREHRCQSIYVKMPLVDSPGMFVVIWTTTPWTLPANLAVAYHPEKNYSQVLAGEETYLVLTSLLDDLSETFGWNNFEIMKTLEGSQMEGLTYRHPFCERTGRLYPAKFVEDSAGTGFVHIAPGHGLEDYGLGMEQGLPIYSPISDDGRLATTGELPLEEQFGSELAGKSILEKAGTSEANRAVLELLRSRDMLLHEASYTHSYPHCWRSKTPVVFRAMDQWFIGIDRQGFRDRALAEIDRVDWIPDWGKNRIEAAVRSRPDWCISRQRTWGVPIPVFYDSEGQPILEVEVIRNTAALVREQGTNVWFEWDVERLWRRVRPAAWSGAEPARKSSDTLDVWIDSGSSSRAVTMRNPALQAGRDGEREDFVADLYLEGSDQHRGWFQSSLLLSLAGNGAAPFRAVLTHGFMVDGEREKISKSGAKGKPQTAESYIKQYGADVLRLWVASQDFRNDIVVSSDRIRKVGETYRAIRNALRFQLSNLFDYDPERDRVAEGDLSRLDRWILGRLGEVERAVLEAYERYEFHVVYQKLSQFVTVDLSATFHDAVKDRLYTLAAGDPKRRSTQTALHRLVSRLSQLLSPILVFTADETWECLPGTRATPSVHVSRLEPGAFRLEPDEERQWQELFRLRHQVLQRLEEKRKAGTIGKSTEAAVVLRTEPSLTEALAEWGEDLREMLNVSLVEFVAGDDAGNEIELNGRTVAVDADALITVLPSGDCGLSKCARCWRWEADVGEQEAHPDLCSRCVAVVTA